MLVILSGSLCCTNLQSLHFSESSMYLPVTPLKSKHRRSLNLLEVPHPQLGPHVKPNKVSIFTHFHINPCHPLRLQYVYSRTHTSLTALLSSTCRETRRARLTLQP